MLGSVGSLLGNDNRHWVGYQLGFLVLVQDSLFTFLGCAVEPLQQGHVVDVMHLEAGVL
jgi:hypothetical protein